MFVGVMFSIDSTTFFMQEGETFQTKQAWALNRRLEVNLSRRRIVSSKPWRIYGMLWRVCLKNQEKHRMKGVFYTLRCYGSVRRTEIRMISPLESLEVIGAGKRYRIYLLGVCSFCQKRLTLDDNTFSPKQTLDTVSNPNPNPNPAPT
jgi:hypothetical protein